MSLGCRDEFYFGAMPDSVALSADGAMLYVGQLRYGLGLLCSIPSRRAWWCAPEKPIGFIPTEWYPTAVTVKENKLYVATGKGPGLDPMALRRQSEGSTGG